MATLRGRFDDIKLKREVPCPICGQMIPVQPEFGKEMSILMHIEAEHPYEDKTDD